MAFVFLAARGHCPCDASLCYAIPSRFPLLTNPLPLAGDKAAVFTMAFVFLRRGDIVRVTLRYSVALPAPYKSPPRNH